MKLSMSFKRNAIVSVILTLMTSLPHAASADSTNTGLATVSANVAPNQTFLLDSGKVDFTPSSGLATADPSTGYVCIPSNGTQGCVGKTHGRGSCPVGFVPFISTTISKAVDSSVSSTGITPGMKAVCPAQFWGHGDAPNGYEFQFKSTMATSSGTYSGSSVAFDWAIYCVPGLYTTTSPIPVSPNRWTYTPSQASCNTSPGTCNGQAPTSGQGACSTASITTPQGPTYTVDTPPLQWANGFFDYTPNWQLWATNISSNACPPGYDYFYEVNLVSRTIQGPSTTLGERLCITATSPTSFTPWVDPLLGTSLQQVGSSASFNWSKKCYPPIAGQTYSNPGGANHTLNVCTAPSTSAPFITPGQRQPFLLTSGYVAGHGVCNNWYSFPKCPAGYWGILTLEVADTQVVWGGGNWDVGVISLSCTSPLSPAGWSNGDGVPYWARINNSSYDPASGHSDCAGTGFTYHLFCYPYGSSGSGTNGC